MRIMPKIVNYTVSTNNNKTQNQNTVSTPAFCACVKGDVFKRTINLLNDEDIVEVIIKKHLLNDEDIIKVITKKYLTKNELGSIPINSASIDKMQEIHKNLECWPDIIQKMHLTKDIFGNLPIHLVQDLGETQEIHKALKYKPDIIAKIHLTQNNFGDLPIHSANFEKTREIHKALKEQPDIIAKMHLTRNIRGELPIHFANFEKMQEIHNVLKEQPDVIAKMHLTKEIHHGNLPIHFVKKLEEIQEIHNVLKDQPAVITKMHLTENILGALPIDKFCYLKMADEKAEILRKITDAALNSDLDIQSSINLLKKYNLRYSEAIKELEKRISAHN